MNERRAAIRLFLLHLTSRHRFAVLALFARDLFSMITLFMSDTCDPVLCIPDARETNRSSEHSEKTRRKELEFL